MGGAKLIHLEIVGIFPTEEYQKCKFYADYLHKYLPKVFDVPKYRPMFDVQWNEFLTKSRRNLGIKLWKLDAPVAVFIDGSFFGGDKEFVRHCNVTYRYHAFENFELLGKQKLVNFISNSERAYTYLTLSVEDEIIGTLLIQLFTELVPLTCANFLRLINDERRGFQKSPVHRIVKTSWIQIGGYNLKHSNMPCENYFVSHDQRGIISMCNSGKHRDNSTQFFISLEKSEWMDYYYVAFGQVLHGEDVLQKIESVPTVNESPTVPVIIESCGEYSVERKPTKKFDYRRLVENTEEKNDTDFKVYPDDVTDFRDVDSVFSERKLLQGLYSVCMPPESSASSKKL